MFYLLYIKHIDLYLLFLFNIKFSLLAICKSLKMQNWQMNDFLKEDLKIFS